MKISTTLPLLLAAALSASGALAQQQQRPAPSNNNRGEVPLIPRDVLFGNPDRAQGRISPDGQRISFIAPLNGVLNVWVAPAADISAAQAVTADEHRGIRQHFWAYDGNHVVYVQDKGGDENWRVYSVNLDSGETRDLTPLENVQARISAVSHKSPQEIVVALNDRPPHQFHDLYRVNINTGERTLLFHNDAYIGFEVDDDYRVRIAAQFNPDGSLALLKASAVEGAEPGAITFQPFMNVPQEDTLTTNTIGFDTEGSTLYYLDSRNRNTAALFAMNMQTGETRLLAENPRADAGGVLAHPRTGKIQAVSFNYDRVKWTILDPALQPDFQYLRSVADGDITVTSRTLDDSRWTVAFLLDNGPARTYVYDRPINGEGERSAQFLFTNRKDLEGLQLARMHPVIIKSRDGLDLVSYLSLPPWADPQNTGRPNRPLPMILDVHGGPWARDTWGYNAEHQWLANRGYAVLSVNFRGSTGFGKEFINAANHEWAGKMHDDLIDAVDWAIEQKIADPEKVAIMGGSYGGYATLVGLTFTPDRFAAGVNIVGPSNLNTLLASIPPYWKPIMTQFTTRVGDPATEEGRKLLEERSPLNRVDQIQRPLLIGHGANDPRVKQAEADQIVSAMQNHNIPVTYVIYPDEGHGFARPENRMSFYAVTEAFLKEHLGGRYQPIGDDFRGSSVQIPAGADQVPGVPEALETHQKPEEAAKNDN